MTEECRFGAFESVNAQNLADQIAYNVSMAYENDGSGSHAALKALALVSAFRVT